MDGAIAEILYGAYDMHIHTRPSHFERDSDDFELISELEKYGMAGAVIKTHYGATGARTMLVNSHSGAAAKLYGSVVLNMPVGGLNPYAVESELMLGTKMVWLPTLHAKNHVENVKKPYPLGKFGGIDLLDNNGKLISAVYEIIELVRAYNAVLATGHISVAESREVCLAAREQGAQIILTHPDGRFEKVPLDVQTELAEKGVMIEKCWINVLGGHCTAGEMAERIRVLRPEHCIITTDAGKPGNGTPPEQIGNFISELLKNGFGVRDIELMLKTNPERLLNRCI